MLKIQTKLKWPMFLRAKVKLEVSNGKKFLLTSKGLSGVEFQLKDQNENVFIEFREISEGLAGTTYGAFHGQELLLRVRPKWLSYSVEINGQYYRLRGFLRFRLEEFGFICRRAFPLFSVNMKSEFPDDFEMEGLILTSLIWMRSCWNDG